MTDCERTAHYFDGELSPSDEQAALDHLASCPTCQAELGDWVVIETALSRPARRVAVPRSRRRRWPLLVGAIAVAAAAAVAALVITRRDGGVPAAPTIALAETRPIEVRLSAPAFDRHRPYRVDRGGAAHELIALDALAELERIGDRAGLAAAHVLGGDLVRAQAALDAAPPSPARDGDRAAIALLAGDAVAALRASDAAIAGDPALAPAHWNRALALSALDLPLVAAAEFDLVAARGEPGWREEAGARAAALRAPIAERAKDLAAYTAMATAMVAGTGPVVTVEQVRRHPGPARRDLYDALAVAGSAADAAALGPVAAELDRIAGNDRAQRMVAASARWNFTVRARFVARYRALLDGQLDGAASAALVAELARGGADTADMLVDVLLQVAPTATGVATLRAHVAADDAWLGTQIARRDAQVKTASGDLFAAEQALIAADAACRDPAWAMACGGLDLDLGLLYLKLRRLDEASARLRSARARFEAAGAPAHADYVMVQLVNLERLRDRGALAAAYLEEMRLRSPDRCDVLRYVDESLAAIAIEAGDIATARAHLPAPGRCGEPPEAALVVFASVLARLGDPADRARAAAAVTATRAAGGSLAAIADIAEGRLRIDDDPGAGAAQIRAGLGALARGGDAPATAAEIRAWGYASLIGDAARRADWARALALFGEELGRPVPAGCVVAAASDDERAIAVVRGASGDVRGSYQTGRALGPVAVETIVPPALAGALAGCSAVAVIARPPLHGRATLLPPAIPWAFMGPPRPAAASSAAPRRVLITDPRPPAALGLPPLAAISDPGAALVTGTAATPTRVREALRDATYVEIHAHGVVDLDASDTAFVALSPEPDGRFALTAADVAATRLTGAPVVVLAACHGATQARSDARRWSLPDAFLTAGARAVVAAATAIPDDQGAALFTELRARLARGESPAHAVAALRADRVAAGQAWAAGLVVFE